MVIMRFVSRSGEGIEEREREHWHGQLLPDVSKALFSTVQK